MDIQILQDDRGHSDIVYSVPNSVISFKIWLEFERWVPQPEDDPEASFFNMAITLSTDQRYCLNVWTFRYLQVAHKQAQKEGEYLGGSYLFPTDLFVNRLDRQHIVEVVTDLIQENRLREEWLADGDKENQNSPSDRLTDDAEDPIFARLIQTIGQQEEDDTPEGEDSSTRDDTEDGTLITR